MKCEECGEEVDGLYEMCKSIACEDCWLDYWRSEDLGMEESFQDFLNYTLTKVKE